MGQCSVSPPLALLAMVSGISTPPGGLIDLLLSPACCCSSAKGRYTTQHTESRGSEDGRFEMMSTTITLKKRGIQVWFCVRFNDDEIEDNVLGKKSILGWWRSICLEALLTYLGRC